MTTATLRNEPLLADVTHVLDLLELADKMPLTAPEDKLVRALRETLQSLLEERKKLEAVEESVEEQYKDGVCLWCGWQSGGSLEFHCCWVGHFDRILKEGE